MTEMDWKQVTVSLLQSVSESLNKLSNVTSNALSGDLTMQREALNHLSSEIEWIRYEVIAFKHLLNGDISKIDFDNWNERIEKRRKAQNGAE